MSNPFFERPILNSPYECPGRHWELDSLGQPTQQIIEQRRRADFITPIPKPKKRKTAEKEQKQIIFDEGKGLSTAKQQAAGLAYKVLDENVETSSGYVSLCTMHLAKGLEFRAVAVMSCDDEVVPLQERIAAVGEDADLQEVYDTERHLLYVACTRARDYLLITATKPASEFLDDLKKG